MRPENVIITGHVPEKSNGSARRNVSMTRKPVGTDVGISVGGTSMVGTNVLTTGVTGDTVTGLDSLADTLLSIVGMSFGVLDSLGNCGEYIIRPEPIKVTPTNPLKILP